MANKSKSKEKNKETNKRGVKKNSSLGKTASVQKENRLNTDKGIAPDPNDSIAMSQQLLKKISARNSTRTKRQSKRTRKNHPTGKPMPSLSDLEKMFEDSDDESDKINDTPLTQQATNNSYELSLQPDNSILTNNSCMSPTIITEAHERVPISTHISHDDAIILEPKVKRLKLQINDDVSDDKPIITMPPEGVTTDNDPHISNVEQFQSRPSNNSTITQCSKNVINPVVDDDNMSDKSSDSNKTIEYKLPPCSLETKEASQQFFPLPSTSTDTTILSKNDELFLKSIKEVDNNLPKNGEDSNSQTENLPEVVVIDDDINEEPHTFVKEEIDTQPQIVDPTVQNIAVTNIRQYDDDDDDDVCIILDSDTETKAHISQQPDITELEYNLIDNDQNENSVSNEVINVDALIAQNQSILDKYKSSESPNLVIDVDVSTTVENPDGNSYMDSIIQHPPTIPAIPKITPDNQAHWSSEGDIISISDYDSTSRDNIRRNQVRTTHNNIFTQQEISIFVNNLRHCNTNHNVTHDLYHTSSNPYQYRENYFSGRQRGQHASSVVHTTPQTSTFSQKTSPPTSTQTISQSSSLPKASTGTLGECPICMEKLSGKILASTICGHVFCMECLKKAVKTNKKCPTCRKGVKNNGYHKIFL